VKAERREPKGESRKVGFYSLGTRDSSLLVAAGEITDKRNGASASTFCNFYHSFILMDLPVVLFD